jgi:hypothetical protein
MGTEHYQYKKEFSTGQIYCARVMWFRPSFRYVDLILANYVLMAAWRAVAKTKDFIRKLQAAAHVVAWR